MAVLVVQADNMEQIIETWKPVTGYEGLYEVSNIGRVKSLNYRRTKEVRILNGGKYTNGYCFVKLYKYGMSKHCSRHRLVAEAFIPNPEGKPEIDHIDNDKENNCVANLRWVTHKENAVNVITKARRFERINPTIILQFNLDNTLVQKHRGAHDAERRTGVFRQSISLCCRGKQNTAGGYIWKYEV